MSGDSCCDANGCDAACIMAKGDWSGIPEGVDFSASARVVVSSKRNRFVNGDFNIPKIGSSPFTFPPDPLQPRFWWFQYSPNPYSGWTWGHNSGVALQGSAWPTDPIPPGDASAQCAFMHDVIGSPPGKFYQRSRLKMGEHKISFDVLGWGANRGGGATLVVTFDDVQILTIDGASVPDTWTLQEVTIIVPQTGIHKLMFEVTRAGADPDDRATMINNVQITRTD